MIGEEQVEVKEERKEDGPNTPWRDIADAAHGKTDGRGRTREQWRGRWQWRRRSHGYHRGKASSALKQRNSANNEQGREGREADSGRKTVSLHSADPFAVIRLPRCSGGAQAGGHLHNFTWSY